MAKETRLLRKDQIADGKSLQKKIDGLLKSTKEVKNPSRCNISIQRLLTSASKLLARDIAGLETAQRNADAKQAKIEAEQKAAEDTGEKKAE